MATNRSATSANNSAGNETKRDDQLASSQQRIGSNNNADECKKAVNYEFILTSGNFT